MSHLESLLLEHSNKYISIFLKKRKIMQKIEIFIYKREQMFVYGQER